MTQCTYTAAAFAKSEQEELQRERREGVKHHTVGGKQEMTPFHRMIEEADGFAQVCFLVHPTSVYNLQGFVGVSRNQI